MYNKEGTALGVCWPKGLLLHGPPGCGKTLVTRSVAAEFDAEIYEISAANVFGAYTGDTFLLARTNALPRTSVLQDAVSVHHVSALAQHMPVPSCKGSVMSKQTLGALYWHAQHCVHDLVMKCKDVQAGPTRDLHGLKWATCR